MVVRPVPDGGEATLPTRADPALVKALARAFRYQRLLDEGRYASISEMAAAEKLDRGYLGRVLQLTLLAPDIVDAILNGRQPPELGLLRLLESFAAEWLEQRQALLHVGIANSCLRSHPSIAAMIRSCSSGVRRPIVSATRCATAG